MPAFEAIASTTLSSASASITFSSIPASYEHLQIRAYWRLEGVSAGNSIMGIRFNGDTGNNYAWHSIQGDGASISGLSGANNSRIYCAYSTDAGATANFFSVCIVDIVDYASPNKTTVVRSTFGADRENAGIVGILGGLWTSTSAVTSIEIGRSPTGGTGSLTAGSVVSLYGLRGS